MKQGVLVTATLLCAVTAGCSKQTRNAGTAATRSVVHDVDRAAADLRHDTAPLRRTVAQAGHLLTATSRQVIHRVNRAAGHRR